MDRYKHKYFYFILLISFLMGFLLTSACSNNVNKNIILQSFSKKASIMTHFSADMKVTSVVLDKKQYPIPNLSVSEKRTLSVDFARNQLAMSINNNLTPDSYKQNSQINVYAKNNMMYIYSYGNWLLEPIDKGNNSFSKIYDVESLQSIYNDLSVVNVRNNLNVQESNKKIVLSVSNLKNVFEPQTLKDMFGPVEGIEKAKVSSYSIYLELNPKTYLPTLMKREISVVINGETYKTNIEMVYKNWNKVNIKIPQEAFKASLGE